MLMIRNKESKRPVTRAGAPAAFAGAGMAAAFGAAACCALPAVFAGAGLGTAWLTTVGLAASPYREPLLAFAAVSLISGTILLWRQQRAAHACAPRGFCASRPGRLLTLAGLIVGTTLLWLGYSYL